MPASPSANIMDIANQLVSFCREGKHVQAVDALYAEDVVSVEVMECPESDLPKVTQGIVGVRAKNTWWMDNHETHSSKVSDPLPHGDRFIVIFDIDVTSNAEGPMKGQRYQMQEAGLYTVNDAGKIVKEEFFYHMG